MKRIIAVCCFVWATFFVYSAARGGLVVAGGAIEADTTKIYDKMIEMAGGTNARFGIIPAATGRPVKYSRWFIRDLVSRGVPEQNIIIIKLAVSNDSLTPDINESEWVNNGDNDEVVQQILSCNAVWFLGGNQMNILKVLKHEDGSNTKAMDALNTLYRNGGVIAGTSAGAAVQSEIMIAGGDSLSSLTMDMSNTFGSMNDQEVGPLVLKQGLGFFTHGTIDQHFDRKSRLGRLIRVAADNRNKYRYSFGVDENTAMIYYPDNNTIEVVGTGSVTIIDVSEIRYRMVRGIADIQNIKLSIIEEGDSFNIGTGEFTIAEYKSSTFNEEFFNITTPIINSGVFSPNGYVKYFASFFLMDNKGTDSIKSYCVNERGVGVELVFRKAPDSMGYWGYRGTSIVDRYSVVNIRLDINPISMWINKILW